jgi:HAD superfamily hydrolase (TIGR01509 family)
VPSAQWVVFDLGETLVDETRNWDRWANYLGVPRFTFHAVLGAIIATERPHTDVLSYFRPGVDPIAEMAAKDAAGFGWSMSAEDLYGDALPALHALRAQGYRLAVFANQPAGVEAFMATLPVDQVATSVRWGVSKPDPRFFERVATTLEVAAADIVYVGDRVDNDVVPAKRAGMTAVHLRRGPWGYIHAEWPAVAEADIRIDSLAELPGALDGWKRRIRADRQP